MAMDIDPRLREPPQTVTQPFSVLPPPSSYSRSPIRLPPPQHQQPQQQHHSALPSWPQEGTPYYSLRPESQHNTLPSPDIHSYPNHTYQLSQHGDGIPSSESKRPRACEACRGLKVKCDPDAVKGACRRCAKAGRPCIVTAPSRKRQKKTDNRVAELEKKINALEASLHATRYEASSGSEDLASLDGEDDESGNVSTAPQGRTSTGMALDHGVDPTVKFPPRQRQLENVLGPSQRELGNSPQGDTRKRRLSEYQEEESNFLFSERERDSMRNDHFPKRPIKKPTDIANIHPFLMAENSKSGASSSILADSTVPTHEYADVIDRKILDAVAATNLFEHYNKNMAPHMPIVVFSPDITAGIIRKTKPTLFLAILSIASAQDYPHLQGVLTREIMRTYADRLICKREKSLELIQALQVSTIWYSTDANFYQLIHLAAVMGIELGMSSRARSTKERFLELWRDDSHVKSDLEGRDTIDSKRAWLGCYFLCANAAMGSRRLNLTRWTPYIDECLYDLERSDESLPSDKTLCQWVKLQRLADDLGTQISTDDISYAGVSDPKIQYALKGFERQMTDWKKQKPTQVTSSTLDLGFHVINLYMHDFAMPVDTGLEGVGATRAKLITKNQKAQPEVLTTAHVGALTTCLTSVHGIFDSFLSFEAHEVRSLPIFHFARLARASVLLIRMYFAATRPDSELGKVISSDHMKVKTYLRGLIELLRAAAREGKCEPAYKLSIVLAMLQVQFERSKEGKTGLVDDIDVNSNLEARPVDTESYSSKPGYKKLQLEGGNFAMQPSRPKEPLVQQQQQQQQQQQAPLQPQPPPEIGDRALQVLSEVAMNNPATNGHNHNGDHNGGNEAWYGYNNNNNNNNNNSNNNSNSNSNSNSNNNHSNNDNNNHNHNTPPLAPPLPQPPSIYPSPPLPSSSSSDYYPPIMGSIINMGDDPNMDPNIVLPIGIIPPPPPPTFHDLLNSMHPGFEQAIGMTLDEGDLNIMDDDGFYQIMQAGASLFGGGGG